MQASRTLFCLLQRACAVVALCLPLAAWASAQEDAQSVRAASADDSAGATGLEDLVGVRGSSAETAMQQRGWEPVSSEAHGDERLMYWREARSGSCVAVRVADGRYRAIDTASQAMCARPSQAAIPAGAGFASVCGVTTEGKTYRYACKVDGSRPGKQGERTVLRYPDQTITLDWHEGDGLAVTFEGMNPVAARFTESAGQVRFEFEGRAYFYVHDPAQGQAELRKLRAQ